MKTQFQWRLMRAARYAVTKTQFQWRLMRAVRYAVTKTQFQWRLMGAARYAVTKRLLTALLFASLPVVSASAADQLHLYNWNNYIAPETIKRFEESCKCEVVQTYYSDNEELLAKLAAGAKGYDILVPTGNALQTLIHQGALKPVDKAQLPNLKNIAPTYLNTEFDPGNKYSVPYAMSITLIGYNDEKIRELGIPTDTWAAVFDPKILEKLKKRITVLDSANELFAAALKYLGYSANDVDEAHWKQAADTIKKAKPYWAAFNASSYIKELTVGNIWLVHGYSNDIFQANLDAQAAGRKFRIVHALPKEGAVLALDNMVIHKDAPRPDLAHKFMNFMLDGKNSSELTNLIGSGNPNAAAMQYIKPEIAKNHAIFPDQATLAKLEQLKDLNVKQRRLRSRLWTEIKAAR
jgi:spermidine/putrescine transport system substrate-binding protein